MDSFDSGRQTATRSADAGSRHSGVSDEHDHGEIPLIGSSDSPFQILRTYWISIANCVLLVAYAVFIWLFPGWPSPSDWSEQEEPLFVIICVNGGVWIFSTFCDRVLSNFHHIVRRHGYLEFYSRLEFLRRLPFYTLSATSVSLAIVLANCMRWIPEVTNGEPSRLLIIQCFLSIQIILIIPFYVAYTVSVIRFNNAKPPADVDGVPFSAGGNQQRATGGNQNQSMGFSASATLPRSSSLLAVSFGEVGVRDEPQLEQLLDRQADLITYYRQRNQHLMRKLARYSALADSTQQAPGTVSGAQTNVGASISMVNH